MKKDIAGKATSLCCSFRGAYSQNNFRKKTFSLWSIKVIWWRVSRKQAQLSEDQDLCHDLCTNMMKVFCLAAVRWPLAQIEKWESESDIVLALCDQRSFVILSSTASPSLTLETRHAPFLFPQLPSCFLMLLLH